KSARLFIVAAEDARPDREGYRGYRILSFRIPEYVLTDGIELDQIFADPPKLGLNSDGTRLLVQLDEEETASYDIGRPRAPKLVTGTPPLTAFPVRPSPEASPAGAPPES